MSENPTTDSCCTPRYPVKEVYMEPIVHRKVFPCMHKYRAIFQSILTMGAYACLDSPLNNFLPGGMYVHAMIVVDKVAGGIEHNPSRAVGSSDRACFFQ